MMQAANPTPGAEEAGPTGPLAGLLRSITRIFASGVSIAHTRLELLTTELLDEVHRAASLVLWAFVALSTLGMGLFIGALVIIFAFWDTHRLLAAVIVMCSFFALAIAAAAVFAWKLRNKPRLLEGTLAELAKDSERLRARL